MRLPCHPLFPLPNHLAGHEQRFTGGKVDPLHQRLRDVIDGGPTITPLLALRICLPDANRSIGKLNSDIAL